ncbi:MAG: transposase [Nitrospirae bacterium]|nr:transposase [Nitrospirota bacterium]
MSAPVRVIDIYHKGSSKRNLKLSSKTRTIRTDKQDYTVLVVTDRMDLSAETIALIYKYRWQIELFFRWFKCILGFKHYFSYSENGLTIQVYYALIASMLITLWTGRKPTKRTYEIFCFYFSGWVTDEELATHILFTSVSELF